MVEALRIYRILARARLRSDLQYRASFVIFTFSQGVITALDFAAIAVIFGQVHSLAGWKFGEVALLYGIGTLAFGLSDLLLSQVELLPQLVRLGTFDRILIRPAGALVQVLAEDFALRRAGKLIQSLIVLTVALRVSGVHWTAGRIVMLPVAVAAGTVIYGALWVFSGAVTFVLLDSREVINAFTYGGSFLGEYPLDIYGAWLRRLLAFVVPLAFTGFYPSLYLLDRPDPFHGPAFLPFASPAVAVLFAALAAVAWRAGVRRYRSTGS